MFLWVLFAFATQYHHNHQPCLCVQLSSNLTCWHFYHEVKCNFHSTYTLPSSHLQNSASYLMPVLLLLKQPLLYLFPDICKYDTANNHPQILPLPPPFAIISYRHLNSYWNNLLPCFAYLPLELYTTLPYCNPFPYLSGSACVIEIRGGMRSGRVVGLETLSGSGERALSTGFHGGTCRLEDRRLRPRRRSAPSIVEEV